MNTKIKILIGTVLIVGVLACASPNNNDSGGTQVGSEGIANTPGRATQPPVGPFVAFRDGQYEVGTSDGMVAPGKYKTTVPTGSSGCYWERQKSLDGSFDAIIANGTHKAGEPVVVTIAATDKGFKTRGCGEWKKS